MGVIRYRLPSGEEASIVVDEKGREISSTRYRPDAGYTEMVDENTRSLQTGNVMGRSITGNEMPDGTSGYYVTQDRRRVNIPMQEPSGIVQPETVETYRQARGYTEPKNLQGSQYASRRAENYRPQMPYQMQERMQQERPQLTEDLYNTEQRRRILEGRSSYHNIKDPMLAGAMDKYSAFKSAYRASGGQGDFDFKSFANALYKPDGSIATFEEFKQSLIGGI